MDQDVRVELKRIRNQIRRLPSSLLMIPKFKICITSSSMCRLNSPILPLMGWGIKDLIGVKPKTGKVLTEWIIRLWAKIQCIIRTIIFPAIDTLPVR